MASLREHPFDGFDDAAAGLAADTARALEDCIARHGGAVLAVGGGRTPVTVLPLLAQAGCDWSRVTVTLTDERRVAADDPASNEALVRRHLLQGAAASAAFVGLSGDAAPPQPDVVYLGFGEDGHVASLFPEGPELEVGHAGVVAAAAPAAPVRRLSLTLASLLSAKRILILVSGPAKHAVYARAKAGAQSLELPLTRVLHGAGPDIDVYLVRH